MKTPQLTELALAALEDMKAADTKVLVILISDRGRIEQRVLELVLSSDSPFLLQLRGLIDSKIRGLALSEIASTLSGLEESFAPELRKVIAVLLDVLVLK